MPLSYSQLSTYRRCPKQYEYAYVKKVARAISTGESFGSSIHNTLKRWGELEISHQAPAAPNQLELFIDDRPVHRAPLELHTLLTMWRGCFIAEGYASRAEMDMYLLRGEQALRHFFEWWSREKRDVVGIEKSFKWDIKNDEPAATGHAYRQAGIVRMDTVISGRLDRVERCATAVATARGCAGGLRVIDFKSSRPRGQADVDADLQLSIYAQSAAQLWNEPVCELVLLFLGEDECVEACTTRNSSQLKDAQTSIRHIVAGIDAKDFKATPTVEKCRSCPYREICPSRAI
jgi:RecB family exonuclease